jgi:hypothetical protein
MWNGTAPILKAHAGQHQEHAQWCERRGCEGNAASAGELEAARHAEDEREPEEREARARGADDVELEAALGRRQRS